MFYERFEELCYKHGEKPTSLMESLGFTRGLASKWKNCYNNGKDPMPDALTMIKIAKHFGVSVEYLALGEQETEEDELIRILNSVNMDGRQKIMDYAKDIFGNPRYQQDTVSAAV